MKTVKIYLFSATGNTRKVTKEFAAKLTDKGLEVKIEEIDKETTAPNEDMIGIAYPIHAFNAPENVLKFAKGLPKCEDKKPVFIIKSGGEPLFFNNPSSAKLGAILRKKGYEVIGDYLYVMPYNMLYKHTESMATKMWFAAKRRIERDVNAITEGQVKKLAKATPVSFIFRAVEQPFMNFNGRFFKVNEEKCIGCNKCVNSCPQKNITIKDGKISFGKNCIGCVRCSFGCPTDAINIGIINFWKVNGAYTYGDVEPEVAECKYLKKAYAKYFEKSN